MENGIGNTGLLLLVRWPWRRHKIVSNSNRKIIWNLIGFLIKTLIRSWILWMRNEQSIYQSLYSKHNALNFNDALEFSVLNTRWWIQEYNVFWFDGVKKYCAVKIGKIKNENMMLQNIALEINKSWKSFCGINLRGTHKSVIEVKVEVKEMSFRLFHQLQQYF